MLDTELRTMIDGVKDGRMDRRAFIQRMIGLGLTAPMATQMLAIGGVAMAQTPAQYKPTKRGGGGPLKTAVVAGADPAQSAFRRRHQGPGRLAHVLRAARRLGRATAISMPMLAAEIPIARRTAAWPPTASRSPGS